MQEVSLYLFFISSSETRRRRIKGFDSIVPTLFDSVVNVAPSLSLSRLNFSTAAKSSNTHNFDLPPFVVVVVVGCVCLFNGHVYTSSRNDTTIHTRRNKEIETKKNWATEFACLSLSQECDTAHRAPSNPNATSPVGMPSTSCLCLPIAATLRRLSTLIIISYRASDIFQIK